MNREMRYRLRAADGRFASYALGPLSASLAGEETAYVFRLRPDAESAASAFEKHLGERLSVDEYPAIAGTLRVGDRVKFAAPQSVDEQAERFEIIELRGDRALVRFLDSGMRVAPTFVHSLEDLATA